MILQFYNTVAEYNTTKGWVIYCFCTQCVIMTLGVLLILCREGWNGRGITNEILRDYWISKLMSCYLFPLHWFNHRWKEMILYLQNQLKIYKINQKLKTCNHVARLLRLYSATINMCYWHLWTINSSAVFSYIEKTRVKTKKIENIHWSFFFFFWLFVKI